MKVKAEMLVLELWRNHPETRKVFRGHGMKCPSCKGAEHETIRRAALNHGLALASFLEELQTALRSGS